MRSLDIDQAVAAAGIRMTAPERLAARRAVECLERMGAIRSPRAQVALPEVDGLVGMITPAAMSGDRRGASAARLALVGALEIASKMSPAEIAAAAELATKALPTLDDVTKAVGLTLWDPAEKNRIIDAVKRFSEALGQHPENMLADIGSLKPKLRHIEPAALGVTGRTLKTMKSRLWRGIELVHKPFRQVAIR